MFKNLTLPATKHMLFYTKVNTPVVVIQGVETQAFTKYTKCILL